MFEPSRIHDAMAFLYLHMTDTAFKTIDDGMKGESKTYLRFQISHRIFRSVAKTSAEGVEFADFFEKEWNRDPPFILTLMDIICADVDCEKIMERTEEQKDKREITEYHYLVACNIIKTIYEYKTTEPGTLIPQFIRHRLTSSS
jgi:hypothetical protein